MNSIGYPNMFSPTSTLVVKDLEASTQDLLLLLSSEKGELLGDPFFGVRLKRFYYDQNDRVLEDILIDEMLSQIRVFAPQLSLTRKDIKIERAGKKMYVTIRATNRLDFTTNMYRVELLKEGEM